MATIISISGASASGKTTVAREALGVLPGARMLLSLTTRPPRPSDVAGEYRYVSNEEFEELERSDSFLWSVGVHGNRYGTLKETVASACDSGISIAILAIPAAERLAAYLQASAPSVRFMPIYLRVKDERILLERLRGRGDSEHDVQIRLQECRTWNDLAERSSVPFHFIDSGAPQQHMLAKAVAYIQSEIASQDSRSSTKRG